MEGLISAVEAGEDLETVIRAAREQVPDLWDKVDTSALEERLVKVQHAALEAGWNSMREPETAQVKEQLA